MSQSSFYGRFGGGVGRQRVLQLLSCDSTAACRSPNTVLWGMEAYDRMDGQDTETGVLTPVLQRPSSIQGLNLLRTAPPVPGG